MTGVYTGSVSLLFGIDFTIIQTEKFKTGKCAGLLGFTIFSKPKGRTKNVALLAKLREGILLNDRNDAFHI